MDEGLLFRLFIGNIMQTLPEAFWVFVIIVNTMGIELFFGILNKAGGSVSPYTVFRFHHYSFVVVK